MYILYILNKITLTTQNTSTVLHNLFLLDMSIFNELVNKDDPVKKATSFFFFMEGVQVLSRLYRNSNFDILANFNLVLLTS